jgi:hypothetical protein
MSEPLSKEFIDSIKQRCEATTKGPWIASVEGCDHPLGGETLIIRGKDPREDDLYLFGGTVEDYDFVANAKQDIPLLLEEIERLQEEIKRLQNLLNSC